MIWQKFLGKRQKIVWMSVGLIVATLSSAAVVIEIPKKASPADETKTFTSKSLEMNCEFNLPDQIDANSFRLLGKNCRIEALTNKTNGFTASFFNGNENKWSTDFIYLSEGQNELYLEFFDKSGKLNSKTVTIQGRMPASAQL